MRIHGLAFALALLVSACAVAGAADPVDTRESIVVGGVTRTYVLHLPTTSGRVPLVLAFHGHGGTGAGQARLSGLDALADRYGFIVAYPDGIDRGWNDGRATRDTADDLGFVNALIDDLERRYRVDPKRIYATGMSNGAVFSQFLGCNLAGRLAAIAPVAGSLAEGYSCRPQRAISVLEIGGTADPVMPYDGGAIGFTHRRSSVLSVDATIAFWAHNDACAAHASATALPLQAPPDGTSIQRTLYGGCRDGTAVALYTVAGGGHTWPDGWAYLPKALIGPTSRQLDASATIVAFFLAHPMR